MIYGQAWEEAQSGPCVVYSLFCIANAKTSSLDDDYISIEH
jgi:hypothetical protein